MGRSTVHLDLVADAHAARDLASGRAFVRGCALALHEQCELIVAGADRELRLEARVIQVDGRGGATLELLKFGSAVTAQIADLVVAMQQRTPEDDFQIELGSEQPTAVPIRTKTDDFDIDVATSEAPPKHQMLTRPPAQKLDRAFQDSGVKGAKATFQRVDLGSGPVKAQGSGVGIKALGSTPGIVRPPEPSLDADLAAAFDSIELGSDGEPETPKAAPREQSLPRIDPPHTGKTDSGFPRVDPVEFGMPAPRAVNPSAIKSDPNLARVEAELGLPPDLGARPISNPPRAVKTDPNLGRVIKSNSELRLPREPDDLGPPPRAVKSDPNLARTIKSNPELAQSSRAAKSDPNLGLPPPRAVKSEPNLGQAIKAMKAGPATGGIPDVGFELDTPASFDLDLGPGSPAPVVPAHEVVGFEPAPADLTFDLDDGLELATNALPPKAVDLGFDLEDGSAAFALDAGPAAAQASYEAELVANANDVVVAATIASTEDHVFPLGARGARGTRERMPRGTVPHVSSPSRALRARALGVELPPDEVEPPRSRRAVTANPTAEPPRTKTRPEAMDPFAEPVPRSESRTRRPESMDPYADPQPRTKTRPEAMDPFAEAVPRSESRTKTRPEAMDPYAEPPRTKTRPEALDPYAEPPRTKTRPEALDPYAEPPRTKTRPESLEPLRTELDLSDLSEETPPPRPHRDTPVPAFRGAIRERDARDPSKRAADELRDLGPLREREKRGADIIREAYGEKPDPEPLPAREPEPGQEATADDFDFEQGTEEERRIARNIHERLRGLTLAEQIKKANSYDSTERMLLERMYGKNVWEPLLRNPRLTGPEVSRIARMGQLPRPMLELICNNGAWLQIPEIRRALLANPRLGTDQILRVLKLLPKHELKTASMQTAYPFPVRDAAKRLLRDT